MFHQVNELSWGVDRSGSAVQPLREIFDSSVGVDDRQVREQATARFRASCTGAIAWRLATPAVWKWATALGPHSTVAPAGEPNCQPADMQPRRFQPRPRQPHKPAGHRCWGAKACRNID